MLKKLTEHVGAMHKNSGDVHTSIMVENWYRIPAPTAPTPVDPDHLITKKIVQMHIFNKKLDALVKCKELLDLNIQKLYSLILGQCTNLLQTKLKQQVTWKAIEHAQNRIALLGLIKTMVHHFEDQKFLPLALYNAKLNVNNFLARKPQQ